MPKRSIRSLTCPLALLMLTNTLESQTVLTVTVNTDTSSMSGGSNFGNPTGDLRTVLNYEPESPKLLQRCLQYSIGQPRDLFRSHAAHIESREFECPVDRWNEPGCCGECHHRRRL